MASPQKYDRHPSFVGHHADAALGDRGPFLRPRSGEANWYYYHEFGKCNNPDSKYHEYYQYKSFEISFADGLFEVIAKLIPADVDPMGIRHMSTANIVKKTSFEPLGIATSYNPFPLGGDYPYFSHGVALSATDNNKLLLTALQNKYAVDALGHFTGDPTAMANTVPFMDASTHVLMTQPNKKKIVVTPITGNGFAANLWNGVDGFGGDPPLVVPVGLEIERDIYGNAKPTGYWQIDKYFSYFASQGGISSSFVKSVDELYLARVGAEELATARQDESNAILTETFSIQSEEYVSSNQNKIMWGSGTGHLDTCFMNPVTACITISYHGWTNYNNAVSGGTYFPYLKTDDIKVFDRYEIDAFGLDKMAKHMKVETNML